MKHVSGAVVLSLIAGSAAAHPHFNKTVTATLAPNAEVTITYNPTPANEVHAQNAKVGEFVTLCFELYDEFFHRVRAGVVNWNRQITGASGKLPFGGVGLSGNHRPSGYFAIDYCSYPVASLEAERVVMPEKMLPGFNE